MKLFRFPLIAVLLCAAAAAAQTQQAPAPSAPAAQSPATQSPATGAQSQAADNTPAAQASAASGQQPTPAVSDADAIKQRSTALYNAIISTDRITAQKLVAPESRNDFANLRLDGLIAANIKSLDISPDGSTAVATVLRTYHLPSIPMLDVDIKDNWKRIDGEWYFALPDIKAQLAQTPFGDVKPAGPPDPAVLKAWAEHVHSADPDQVVKALDRVNREEKAAEDARLKAAADAQAAADAKAAEKSGKKTKKKKMSPQN